MTDLLKVENKRNGLTFFSVNLPFKQQINNQFCDITISPFPDSLFLKAQRNLCGCTPIFRVRIHFFLSSDISSEINFDLSMKNININIKSQNENVNEDFNDNN